MKYKAGDRVRVVFTGGHIHYFCEPDSIHKIESIDKKWEGMDYLENGCCVLDSDIEPYSGESRRKGIQSALMRIYNKDADVKSEDIIESVKVAINDDYIFSDTILRELRTPRQDGKISYDCPNRKERIYKFKQIKQ